MLIKFFCCKLSEAVFLRIFQWKSGYGISQTVFQSGLANGEAFQSGCDNRRIRPQNDPFLRPRDRRVEQFPRKDRRIVIGQYDEHILETRTLRFVNRHGENRFMFRQFHREERAEASRFPRIGEVNAKLSCGSLSSTV